MGLAWCKLWCKLFHLCHCCFQALRPIFCSIQSLLILNTKYSRDCTKRSFFSIWSVLHVVCILWKNLKLTPFLTHIYFCTWILFILIHQFIGLINCFISIYVWKNCQDGLSCIAPYKNYEVIIPASNVRTNNNIYSINRKLKVDFLFKIIFWESIWALRTLKN